MVRPRRLPRFSLRTLMLGVTLLGVGFALLVAYLRPPPNQVTEATMNRLVARIKPGMTVDEISQVFGFDRRDLRRELGLAEDEDPTWMFLLTDRRSRHGSMVLYVGKFSGGRLHKGGLFYPIW
jgi:hypothetical protein